MLDRKIQEYVAETMATRGVSRELMLDGQDLHRLYLVVLEDMKKLGITQLGEFIQDTAEMPDRTNDRPKWPTFLRPDFSIDRSSGHSVMEQIATAGVLSQMAIIVGLRDREGELV